MAINSDKSEALLLSTPHRTKQLASLGLTVVNAAGSSISFGDHFRTLGVVIDKHLSFDQHMASVCRSEYYHLKSIRQIRNMLTEDDANTLACAFVHSKLDYGNALLYNTSNENLKKMQRLQNALARVVKQAPRRSPSLQILKQLHWLPVKARIDFKIASLTYKVLNTGEPVQLRELLKKLF